MPTRSKVQVANADPPAGGLVSRRRRAELLRQVRQAKAIERLILVHDDQDPPYFNPSDRRQLRDVLRCILEVECSFERLSRLSSDKHRANAKDDAIVDISAYFQDYKDLAWLLHSPLFSIAHDTMPFPKSDREIYRKHRTLLRRLKHPSTGPYVRLRVLLSLMRIELMWLGSVW